jgi:DNA repair exonuclease SbcCD ATPase subunit
VIIKTLRAINVLKYTRLELNDLPTKGQIGVSGPNESGKTAIVETICFALFGRTFSQGPENITRIIRWGETDCQVELYFTGSDENDYRIKRSVNLDGLHAAELYRSNEKEPFATGPSTVHDALVNVCRFDYPQYIDAIYLAQLEISAPHSQSDTIKAIAGTSELEQVINELQEEIIDEQEEITEIETYNDDLHKQIEALNVDNHTLSTIETEKSTARGQIDTTETDITNMKQASLEIQEACDKAHETSESFITSALDTSLNTWRNFSDQLEGCFRTVRRACASITTGSEMCDNSEFKHVVEDLPYRLSAFDAVREQLNRYRSHLAHRLGEQTTPSNEHTEFPSLPDQISKEYTSLVGARVRLAFSETGFILFTLIALTGWAGWWLLQPPRGSGDRGATVTWLESNVTWWDTSYLSWVQPVAITVTVIALLLLVVAVLAEAGVKKRRRRIEEAENRVAETKSLAEFVDSVDEMAFPQAAEGLRNLGDDSITQALDAFQNDEGDIFAHRDKLTEYQEYLAEVLEKLDDQLGHLRESMATEIGRLSRIIEEKHGNIEQLDTRLVRANEKLEQAESLRERITANKSHRHDHEQRIKLLELAIKLTTGTCRNIYSRFNSVLSNYTGEVMPKLTEGRYRQMQIDDNFNVKIFSSEKSDFADLDEFSSGTQRQMLLAVRLAMAKALVDATQSGKQFIILDEPFAFFDKERIRNTLKSLPDFDSLIKQIWIISQEFETHDRFKLSIACSRNLEELIVGKRSPMRIGEESAAMRGNDRG